MLGDYGQVEEQYVFFGSQLFRGRNADYGMAQPRRILLGLFSFSFFFSPPLVRGQTSAHRAARYTVAEGEDVYRFIRQYAPQKINGPLFFFFPPLDSKLLYFWKELLRFLCKYRIYIAATRAAPTCVWFCSDCFILSEICAMCLSVHVSAIVLGYNIWKRWGQTWHCCTIIKFWMMVIEQIWGLVLVQWGAHRTWWRCVKLYTTMRQTQFFIMSSHNRWILSRDVSNYHPRPSERESVFLSSVFIVSVTQHIGVY